MKHTTTHRIVITVKYIYTDNTPKAAFDTVGRNVTVDGRRIYSDSAAAGLYFSDTSPLRRFELWVIGADRSFHKINRRQDRVCNRRNLLGFFKQIWRKLFAKQIDL